MWAEQLVQSLVEGIVVLDAAERITFFSRGAERIMGWSSADALGRHFGEVFRPAEGDRLRLPDMISPVQQRLHVFTQHDQPVLLAVTGSRFVSDRGEQVALVLRDITSEATEQHLHSYFLANISHEFRTPLAGLNASIELLLDEGSYLSRDEMDELLNSIYLSTSGLQALVDNLLESANIEAGNFAVHRRPLSINPVIAEAVRLMQPLLDRRQQTLSLTEPLQPPIVYADPARLIQVLINLLSNASKYSPLASTIDLLLRQEGHRLVVAVADRGPGIAPPDRKALFRRFVRLGAAEHEQYGIGLGLSVVKAIIEQHQGEVGVDERPGGGSIFWFTLPLAEEAA